MNQVQKSSSIVEKVVHSIARAKVVVEPPQDSEMMDLQELYELIERQRTEVCYQCCVCVLPPAV